MAFARQLCVCAPVALLLAVERHSASRSGGGGRASPPMVKESVTGVAGKQQFAAHSMQLRPRYGAVLLACVGWGLWGCTAAVSGTCCAAAVQRGAMLHRTGAAGNFVWRWHIRLYMTSTLLSEMHLVVAFCLAALGVIKRRFASWRQSACRRA